MLADTISIVLRALSFVLLFQAAGAAFFDAAFGRELTLTRGAVARIGALAAWTAVPFVLGHYLLEAARMMGEMGGMLEGALQARVLHSSAGAMVSLRILGLLLIGYGLQGDGEGRRCSSVIGATLAMASFALVGHTAASAERWLLSAMLVIHLLIVAYWFGALIPLYLVAARENAAQAALIIERFSQIAAWLVPGILIAGVVIALVLIPQWRVFGEPYGALILAKLSGFALLMLLAALNKWRLGPAIARADGRASRAFRQSVALEYLLIVAVLAATAVMTSLFSPE
jgi:putative copper resistance protein D